MIKKQCIVCGKEIEVVNSRYCLCSDECRKKRRAELEMKYSSDPVIVERRRIQSRERSRKNAKIILCKICGKPVPPSDTGGRLSHKYYHEECVVKEALQAIAEGGTSSKFTGDSRIFRAYNVFGYSVSELKELQK